MTHLFEIIRRKGYWLVDYLRGRPVGRHYNEIVKVLSNHEGQSTAGLRRANLEKLLHHAVSTAPFYKRFENFSELQDFPVINKNLILDHYLEFKSVPYLNDDLYKASSSGSTGIPFGIYQDNTKRNRNTADVIYFSEAAGSRIGDRLFYIKLWDHTNEKKRWVAFLQNILAFNVMDTSSKDIDGLISILRKDGSSKTILGYPSFFEEVCNYLEVHKIKPKIKKLNSIITMSESLQEQVRDRMQKCFEAPIFERYSNQENGILAQQTKESGGKYVLNWGSFHFEFLELDSNRHVKPGCLGRIVVTDLFNFSMPMIRYDTGDMAVYEAPGNTLPYLSKIYGRRMDTVYNTKGKMVSPFIFYMVLEYARVKQFQFIQKGKTEYSFKLNGEPKDVDEVGIQEYFRNYLGQDAIITFEYVQEIPLLSSGKRKKIVNEYMPTDGQ